jgi:hypothetical protein
MKNLMLTMPKVNITNELSFKPSHVIMHYLENNKKKAKIVHMPSMDTFSNPLTIALNLTIGNNFVQIDVV